MDIKLCLFVFLMESVYFGYADESRVTVTEGENAILSCSLSSNFPMVIWKKADYPVPLTVGGNVFVGDSRVGIDRRMNTWKLTIENSVMGDSGEYECRATMDGFAVRKSFYLDVKPAPGAEQTDNVKSNANVTVSEGETASLSCSVKDSSLYNIIWKRVSTGTVISMGYHLFIKDGRINLHVDIPNWDLMIENVKPSDTGNYTCIATDNKRVVMKFFYLEVIPATDEVTTTKPTNTSEPKDDTNKRNTSVASSSEEISDQVLKATQLQFYREEILTAKRKRKIMDIEKDFFEVAKKYFESKTEDDTQ